MRCPYGICDGSGWMIDERTRVAAECRCMPEQRASRAAGKLRARIPREYQTASFEHTNISGLPRPVVRDVRGYVDALDEKIEAGDGLWISGSVGTGKTWLAMLVARYAIERGHPVAVYSVPRLLSEIRRTYDGEGTTTLDLLDQLTSVSLLVLDDVGTERSNPWVLEQLYTIINERWQEQRAIVLTTNLDPIAMQEQIGERTVSRLEGMCHMITIDGVDHRTSRNRPDPGTTRLDPPVYDRDPGAARHDQPAYDHGPQHPGTNLGTPPPFDPRDAGAGPAGVDRVPVPPTWGVDPGGVHRPVRRGHDGRDR